MITFTLQADDGITKSAKTHKIEWEFNLLTGFSIVHQLGYLKLKEKITTARAGRSIIRYDAEMDNASL